MLLRLRAVPVLLATVFTCWLLIMVQIADSRLYDKGCTQRSCATNHVATAWSLSLRMATMSEGYAVPTSLLQTCIYNTQY